MKPHAARVLIAFTALAAALGLVACGGSGNSFSGDEVSAAFEEAAGGYPFETTTTLVEGDAVAYAPATTTDPEEIAGLDDKLGEGSALWQVVVFEEDDPPTGKEAVEEVAFASKKLEELEDNTFLGDSDIAYIVNGNAVVNGPALDGNPDDETLVAWREALEGL